MQKPELPPSKRYATELAPRIGRSVSWHEPGWPSFFENTSHWFATRRVVAAPTSTQALSTGQDVPIWRLMRSAAQRVLLDGALTPGCAAFEVRYVAHPATDGPNQVEVFFTARSTSGEQPARTAVDLAVEKLPLGFETEEVSVDFLGTAARPSPDTLIVELKRHEELTSPEWNFIPSGFYYTVEDSAGDASGWSSFWRTLYSTAQPATVSFLFLQTELHATERGVIGSVLSDLAELGQQRTDYDFLGNPVLLPACVNAQLAQASWQRRVQSLQRPLLARVAVRAEVETAVKVSTALSTAISASQATDTVLPMSIEPALTPAEDRQARFGLDWMEVLPWGGHGVWQESDAPTRLRRMPYLYGAGEASGILVLPVPDEQGVAGVARSRRSSAIRERYIPMASSPEKAVEIGRAVDNGQLGQATRLPLGALNRHALVVGAPGSGKTTTALTILVNLWREHKIPFAVLEGAKTEYRSLCHVDGLEDLAVYTLGNEAVSPLRLNPLSPPPGVRRELHETAVMASLKMALPLLPPLPQILARALARTYDVAGWDDDTTIESGLRPPTLRDLQRNFAQLFATMGYRGDALNIGIAFEARLEGLLTGGRGSLLDTVACSDFRAILNKPCVIELNDVVDPDERMLLSAFVLERIRAAARSRDRSGKTLQHVTVIEEAHRLLPRGGSSSADGLSGDRTRGDAVRAFTEAIAELRSAGEGFILSSQTPSQLAELAVANCGTRILHRLETAADRDVLLRDFDASALQGETASRLRIGEALIRWPQIDEAEFVQVLPAVGVDSSAVVDDIELAGTMSVHRKAAHDVLPFPMCTREVCNVGCTPRVRRRGGDAAKSLSSDAASEWKSAADRGDNPAARVADLLVAACNHEERTSYCGAVHLSLQGDAFVSGEGVDRRSIVVGAIRAAVRRNGTNPLH